MIVQLLHLKFIAVDNLRIYGTPSYVQQLFPASRSSASAEASSAKPKDADIRVLPLKVKLDFQTTKEHAKR